jgi:proline iminopeptidase
VQDTDSLRHLLPDSVQAVIDQHEAAGTFEDPAYQEATMLFYQQFLARKQPWSADIDSTFSQMNPSLYGYMNGPSEFTITGTLKEYDATPRLGELALPTLFTTGEFDEATPATVRYYHSLVPGSQLAIIEDSGHLTMHDAPERNVAVVRDFLRQVEGQ